MKISTFIENFAQDDNAAVTVDWVVLTAAIIGMTLVVLSIIEPGLNSNADTIVVGIGSAVASGLS